MLPWQKELRSQREKIAEQTIAALKEAGMAKEARITVLEEELAKQREK